MKTYDVKKINDKWYSYIIFSTSYEDPFDDIEYIEKELNTFSGKVLFDLLLSNGLSSNRFVEAQFENGHFDTSSFKVLKDINDELKSEIAKFYMENQHVLDNSILNRVQKFMIKRGIIR